MKKPCILMLLLMLVSCGLKHKNTIIAYNFDKSIILTQNSFDLWLEINKSEIYRDKEYQIDSYFLEKELLNKQHIIPNIKMSEIKFKHTQLLYRNAFAPHKKKLVSNIQINMVQFNEMFRKLKEKNLKKKDKVRLYQIYKKYPLNSDSTIKLKYFNVMQNIRNSVTDLNSFKILAQKESDSQSRLKSGLIGNVYHGLLPQSLNDIVMKMKVGELSEIIKTPNGLMLFYCKAHIPANILSNLKMEKIVKNTILSHETKNRWSKYNNDIVDDLKITVDWANINSDTPFKIVVASKLSSLNAQEVEWILNEGGNSIKVNKRKASQLFHNYFVSEYLYNELSEEQRSLINNKNHQIFVDKITSSVLFELMSNSFKAPNDEMLKNYYSQNKNNYKTPIHYDISFILFDLTNKNKQLVYKKASNVINQLIERPEDFEKLSKQHSMITKKYKGSRVKSIQDQKLASYFGFNVTKQIHLLSVDEVSGLVESDSGFLWIVKLNQIEKPRLMTFKEVKSLLDEKLGNEMLNQLKQDFISNLILRQDITIN